MPEVTIQLMFDWVFALDTAVAYLASAIGNQPGRHCLVPRIGDGCCQREDSPWYPITRLFRQPSIGDWDSVITRVQQALSAWIENRTR